MANILTASLSDGSTYEDLVCVRVSCLQATSPTGTTRRTGARAYAGSKYYQYLTWWDASHKGWSVVLEEEGQPPKPITGGYHAAVRLIAYFFSQFMCVVVQSLDSIVVLYMFVVSSVCCISCMSSWSVHFTVQFCFDWCST